MWPRPKLSDGGHGARRLQPRRPAAVRRSAWLAHGHVGSLGRLADNQHHRLALHLSDGDWRIELVNAVRGGDGKETCQRGVGGNWMQARSASIAARSLGSYQRLDVGRLVLAGRNSRRTQRHLSFSNDAVLRVGQGHVTVEAIAIY